MKHYLPYIKALALVFLRWLPSDLLFGHAAPALPSQMDSRG